MYTYRIRRESLDCEALWNRDLRYSRITCCAGLSGWIILVLEVDLERVSAIFFLCSSSALGTVPFTSAFSISCSLSPHLLILLTKVPLTCLSLSLSLSSVSLAYPHSFFRPSISKSLCADLDRSKGLREERFGTMTGRMRGEGCRRDLEGESGESGCGDGEKSERRWRRGIDSVSVSFALEPSTCRA